MLEGPRMVMKQLNLRCALALMTICLAVPADGDSWAFPERGEVMSPQESARFTIIPRRDFGIANKGPYGILERKTDDGSFERLWVARLANRTRPASAVVSDSGKFVVTRDEYGNLGYGDHVIVVYGERGRMLRSWSLSDLLTEEESNGLRGSVSSIWWSCGSARIDDAESRLSIGIRAEIPERGISSKDCTNIAVDWISGESFRQASPDGASDSTVNAEESSNWIPIRPASGVEKAKRAPAVDKSIAAAPAIIRAIRLGARSEEAKEDTEPRILLEVKDLLAAGADPNQVDVKDLSALYWSTETRLYDVARLLVERGADPNVDGADSWNAPFRLAIYWNQTALVSAMLLAGADANKPFDKIKTPLTVAAGKGSTETLDLLLKSGADPNLPTKGNSPLEQALHNYNVAKAKALVRAGADVAALDPKYALYWAVAERDAKAAKAALRACKCQGYPGKHVFAWAAESGMKQMVEVLTKGGVDPNAEVGLWKTTALIEASKMGHTSTVEALLENGADVNGSDVYGFTPLDAALLFRKITVVRVLRKAGGEEGVGVGHMKEEATRQH
jgi:ankyrin repeat protein